MIRRYVKGIRLVICVYSCTYDDIFAHAISSTNTKTPVMTASK